MSTIPNQEIIEAGLELSVLDDKEKAIAIFKEPDGLTKLVEEIQKNARAYVPDLTTDKGRKALISEGEKIRQDRLKIERTMKPFVDDLQAQVDGVKGRGKWASETLNALIVEIQKPAKEYETKEKARKETLRNALNMIKNLSSVPFGYTSAQVQQRLDMLALPDPTQWAEFEKEAADTKSVAKTELEKTLLQIQATEKLAEDNRILQEQLAAAKAPVFVTPLTEPPATEPAPQFDPERPNAGQYTPPVNPFAQGGGLIGGGASIPKPAAEPAAEPTIDEKNLARAKALVAVQAWFAVNCPIYEGDVKFIFNSIDLGEIPHFRIDLFKE